MVLFVLQLWQWAPPARAFTVEKPSLTGQLTENVGYYYDYYYYYSYWWHTWHRYRAPVHRWLCVISVIQSLFIMKGLYDRISGGGGSFWRYSWSVDFVTKLNSYLCRGPPAWTGVSPRWESKPGEDLSEVYGFSRALRLAIPGFHGHAASGPALVLHRVVLGQEKVKPSSSAAAAYTCPSRRNLSHRSQNAVKLKTWEFYSN